MSEVVAIGNRLVGAGEPTLVVAEAGSNHDCRLDRAMALIDASADADADAVKFQLFSADALYPAGSPEYQAVKSVELPREWIPDLAARANARGLLFLASAFDRRAVDCLSAIGVAAHKIASSEVTNLPLVKYIAGQRRPILISTGMCDLADVHDALEVVRSEHAVDVVLLQCTSLYPTEPHLAHLRAMETLRAAFQVPVGFSDHTVDVVVPALAVARGACVIEKHLTLSRQLSGPDHSYALEPHEFRTMVHNIRVAEAALGSPRKAMLREEAVLARRESLRASRCIEAGERLTDEALAIDRPAGGIGPRLRPAVIGLRAGTAIASREAITWDKVEIAPEPNWPKS